MKCICLIALAVNMLSNESLEAFEDRSTPNNATDKQFPFMVMIMNQKNHPECSGSLITYKHVLTAAQCFLYERPKQNQLATCIAGQMESHALFYLAELLPSAQVRKIDSKILHPNAEEYYKTTNYTKYSIEHDLAVIKVNESFNPSEYVSPIEVASMDYNEKERRVLGMGYGLRKPQEGEDEHLIYGNLMIVVDHRFKPLYPTAYFTYGESAECPGDIGSPLYFNNTIIGVGINFLDEYCIYANVFMKVDWILEQSGLRRQSSQKMQSQERRQSSKRRQSKERWQRSNRRNRRIDNESAIKLLDSNNPDRYGAVCKLNGELVIKIEEVLLSAVQILQILRHLSLI